MFCPKLILDLNLCLCPGFQEGERGAVQAAVQDRWQQQAPLQRLRRRVQRVEGRQSPQVHLGFILNWTYV